MTPKLLLRRRRYGAVLGLIVVASGSAVPSEARAQGVVEELALMQLSLSMLPQPAQDSPAGLRSAGERLGTRVWSATDTRRPSGSRTSGGGCFVPPRPELPADEGVCALTVDELLTAGNPGPQVRSGTAESQADLMEDLLGAVRSATQGYARAMRPGPTDAAKLVKEATDAYAEGDAQRALAKAKLALDASVEPGPYPAEAAVALGLVGRICTAMGRTEQAGDVLKRALEMTRRAAAGWNFAAAAILDAQGQLHRQQGAYEAAVAAYEAALVVYQADARGERSAARILNQLALVREETGDYAAALALYERALAVGEKAFGKGDPERATTLANLGGLERRQDRLGTAEAHLRDALAVEELAGRGDGPGAAAVLNQLGLLHHDRGEYDEAERVLGEAQRITDALPGPPGQLSVAIRNNIALLHRDRGEGETALRLLEAAAADQARDGDGDTPRGAALLQNLADTYVVQGRADCAGPLYERAAGVWDRGFGPNHPDTLQATVSLAGLDRERGDLGAAERRLRPALERLEQRLGPDHPEVGRTKNNLAEVLRLQGREDEAAVLYASALPVLERALGAAHPDTSTVLLNRAVLEWQRGAIPEAVRLAEEAAGRRERAAGVLLAYGSEEQKRAFARTLASETAALVSLQAAAPGDPRARALALEAVVRRKGRVLDAAAGVMAVSDRDSNTETRALLDGWRAARGELAALLLGRAERPDAAERADELDRQIQEIERQLSRRSAAVAIAAEPVDLGLLRGRIPDDAALVELTIYTPFAPRGPEAAARYAAFVLRARGEPAFVDLGEAAPIDAAVRDLRTAIVYESPLARKLARRLHEVLVAPLGPSLADARLLLVVPDGALNLLSFALLQDAEGRFLIERYELAYLTTGRDLARLPAAGPSRAPPLVIGDPDFGPTDGGAGPSGCAFARLPGARVEAGMVASQLGDARLLVGGEASEEAIKAVHGPLVLHLATHGFFTEGGGLDPCLAGKGLTRGDDRFPERTDTIAASLLRSGLALAQANRRGITRGEDGLLTALEAAGLDLRGTQLVVLSACDTGLGAVENGEGVLGLRRAFAMAGAEAQLMSLWKASDESTAALMADYYRRLLAGAGRSEALRAAQLAMLRGDRWAEPRYWAAFAPVGAWTPLAGMWGK